MKHITKGRLSQWLWERRYFLLLMGLVSVFCTGHLLYMYTATGHDGLFHMSRIYFISQELQNGNLFARIYHTAVSNCGYASPLFYGDIFLYPFAILHAFSGLHLYQVYDIFHISLYYAAAISMYFCVKSVTGDKRTAFFGAIMLTLSSYFCTDVTVRVAVGEVLVFVFLPVVFAGYYHIMHMECKKWYLLPIGLAMVFYSHVLSSVITVLLLAGFFLLSLHQVKERPERLRYLLVSAAIFFVLTADLMFPMLEQLLTASFRVNDGYAATAWGSLKGRAMPFWAVLNDFNQYSSHGKTVYIPNGMGLAIVALAACMVFYRRPKSKFVVISMVFSFLTLAVITNYFPWEYLQELVGVLQFPWRLLVVPTFLIAFAGALYFNNLEKTRKTAIWMVVVMAFSVISFCLAAMPAVLANKQVLTENITEQIVIKYLCGYEYLPSTIAGEDTENHDVILRDEAEIIRPSDGIQADFTRTHGGMTVRYSGNTDGTGTIEVPLLLYKGYRAELEDGTWLELTRGSYGRMCIVLSDAPEGVITVEYAGTPIQWISRTVSIIGWTAMIVYLIMKKRRESLQG